MTLLMTEPTRHRLTSCSVKWRNVCSCSVLQESQFSVKVECPSPGGHTLHMGEEQDTSPSKLSKEELIQSMDRVDREIAKVEQQIFKLKKKQVSDAVNYFPSACIRHLSVT